MLVESEEELWTLSESAQDQEESAWAPGTGWDS